MQVQPAAAGGEPQLVIQYDRQGMLDSQRKIKRQIRETLLPSRYEGRRFGLTIDDGWADARSDTPLVVLVHGLNAHPGSVRNFAALARRHGLSCGVFRYPNDQPIDDSGRLLSRSLKTLAVRHRQRRVALVTHSMGGLVARAALEDPALDPGNVERLIMVAPPNHGSALSQFAFGLDLWEHFERGDRPIDRWLLFSSIEDGLSEATEDLEPGSVFLTRLNRRPRNPTVKYTIFLGSGGPCTQAELDDVCDKIQWAGRRSDLLKFVGSKYDREISGLDEVVGGKGDGAVAVRRGRLAGVSDTIVLPFGHLDVLHDQQDPAVKQVFAGVLQRLKQPMRSAAE